MAKITTVDRKILISLAADYVGISNMEMRALVKNANNLGMGTRSFVRLEAWEMSEEEIVLAVKNLKAARKKAKEEEPLCQIDPDERRLHVIDPDLAKVVVSAATRFRLGKRELASVLLKLIEDQEKSSVSISDPRFLTRAFGVAKDARKSRKSFKPFYSIEPNEDLGYLVAKFASVMGVQQAMLTSMGKALMGAEISLHNPLALSKLVLSAYKDAQAAAKEVEIAKGAQDFDFESGPLYRSNIIHGMSEEEYEKKIAEVEKLGISRSRYEALQGWDFTNEQLLEYNDLSKQMPVRWAKTKEWCVDVVMEKTGWSRERAVARMDAAFAKGYKYSAFISCALWKLTDESFEVIPPRRARQSSDTLMTDEELEGVMAGICEKMGWTRGQYRLDFMRKRVKFGVSPRDYSAMRLYERTDEDISRFATFDHMCKMRLRYCDYMGERKFFTRKTQFDAAFEPFLKRRWFSNAGLTWEAFLENIEGLDVVFYKPSDGACGRGVAKLPVSTEAEKIAAFEHISTAPVGVVEQALIQHPSIAKIWNGSVNTLRVMTLVKDGEPRILCAVLRVGVEGIIDNIAHGGIGSAINVETGVCSTYPVDQWGDIYEVHPVTKMPMKDFQIPNWDKLVAMIKEAAMVKPDMAYVGWDITITADGEPAIIEGNTDPAIWIVQIPWAVSENVGMADIFDSLTFDFDHKK